MKEEVVSFFTGDSHLPFRISLAGISYCDGTYHIPRQRRRSSVLEYIISGQGTVIANGERFTARAGDVYILHMGEFSEYYSDAANPWVKIFFNIRGNFIEKLLEDYGLRSTYIVYNSNTEHLFMEAYQTAKSRCNDKQVFNCLVGKITEIVATLSDCVYKRNIDAGEMAMVRNYIESNTGRIIKNEELRHLIYRSDDYLIKHFKAEYGVSPYDYQINIKMQIAKELLRNTKLPINEICNMLGYTDQHYFSNVFKNKCGIRPLAYRKGQKGS